MKKSKFSLSLLVCSIICSAFLVACANPKLSTEFNEDEVKQSVRDVITFINAEDSKSLLEKSNVAMKDALTEDVLQQIYESVNEGGEFKEIDDISVGGQKGKSTEEEFAVAVAKAKYENKTFIYTISFTKQMKLAGLFYK